MPVTYTTPADTLHTSCNISVRASLLKLLAAVLILSLAACNKSQPAAPRDSSSAPHAELQQDQTTGAGSAKQSASDHGAVKAEFRNVMFHLTPDAAAHLESVSGELRPVGKYDMPVFDDKTSFEIHVSNGTVSITPDALATIMNEHVFARSGSPMKDISIKIKEDRLVIKGKLHSKGDLLFETGGELTVNADGRLRLHSEKVKALHVPVTKVMSLIGIELTNVINTSKIPGMESDKNDLIFDLGDLLPPPHIRGKITAARLGRNLITVIYGDGNDSSASVDPRSSGKIAASKFSDGKAAVSDLALPTGAKSGEQREASVSGNYMLFRGNRVKFGKLTMENTDLTVIDLDAKDPLDWDQDWYKAQLVAGYSKITDQFGLRTYVKDLAKLPKSSMGANQRTAQPDKR
jgi:hypothetical protein